MSNKPEYSADVEFSKLIARRSEIELTTVALELARDAYPNLDFQTSYDWIDARVKELSSSVTRVRSERKALEAIARCISESHGIQGDKESFDSADGSYLNRVIETGRGIPISLSVLYMAVANRLGLELEGVSSPLHFLTRCESVDGPLFVDAFSSGKILTLEECTEWIGEISDHPQNRIEDALKPANPRTIVIRMLNNLKTLYARQENWPAAWTVQHRLKALQPGSYQERRDLAMISLRADRPAEAFDLLKSCLNTCPTEERSDLEAHLGKANDQLSRWN